MPHFYADNLTDAQVSAIRSLLPSDTEAFSITGADGSDAVRAVFSVSASSGRTERDGFAVYPNSLLFRSGDYPDKNFSLAPDELRRAAKEWTPICGNIAHTDMLNGRAAFIDRVWTEDSTDGAIVLRGEVRVPLALDQMLTDGEKRVSMEWNKAGKFADGFALVTNPRISDAALMSLDTSTSTDKTPMTFLDKLKAFFSDNGVALPEAESNGGNGGAAEPDAEKEALRKRVIDLDAAQFAEAEIAAGRGVPAQRADLIAAFSQAAIDDAALPANVTFSSGTETKTGSRVDALKAAQARRPKVDLTTEQIANVEGGSGELKVVFSDSGATAPEINYANIYSQFECRPK